MKGIKCRKYEFLAIMTQKVDNMLGNPTNEKSIKGVDKKVVRLISFMSKPWS